MPTFMGSEENKLAMIFVFITLLRISGLERKDNSKIPQKQKFLRITLLTGIILLFGLIPYDNSPTDMINLEKL